MAHGTDDQKSNSSASTKSPSATARGSKPTKFQQLMGRMATTLQFPIDLQPINPAAVAGKDPWSMEDLAKAGLPQTKAMLAMAVWYSDLSLLKADLKN